MNKIITSLKYILSMKCVTCRAETESLFNRCIEYNWQGDAFKKLEEKMVEPCQCVDVIFENITE